ncbi:MAG TPA: membrane protein insertion efficiency factor YidD [Fervidobacterium sp.]|nr:membrane protein insertion efficiency factor YidD [Fervidobacterium sp.]HOM74204.1 membrane protein insertion efficiency factor YidD [Fervidobacterium sp.]HOQ39760.1 membrane protein insertion efficiency factor YidD [Fervidobacterium sp.]HPP17894.1 membrane protein insertion efficiency factor YidD [Fervidobacterium sp.]HPT54226.1 membrane protein insertion efficiency factor YidD [Fervidobacterium sp.]
MRKVILAVIRFYQRFISPLKPPTCRFEPTCSTYTYQAVEKFGVFKGLLLGFRRVLRCNPLSEGGYDPVPNDFHLFHGHENYSNDYEKDSHTNQRRR